MAQGRVRLWRLKAEKLRSIAEDTEDDVQRRHMLRAAAAYDAMATAAEPRRMGERLGSAKK
jgi:hypothetical protein